MSIKKSQNNVHLHENPIAIIGMASIFPQARNIQEYWENILKKVDCIIDVPADRWKIEDYYDPDPKTPDKSYSKRGGFIPDIDFDPTEFGLPPNLLEATDVSQLLSLLVAKEALQDAGYDEGHNPYSERTGVILGTVIGQQLMRPLIERLQFPIWEKVLLSCGLSQSDTDKVIDKIKSAYPNWEENSFPGFLSNVIAGRIANRLDLGGLNCTVDAACASSLAALRMAVSELSAHRTDMMITGGVDIDNSILTYMCFSKTPAFSKKTNVRPFDIESDGMMVGEGLGMLVLKRLEDAERDGDRIYAVIKGIGASSDGKFKSIYAPRGEGQARALRRAYEDAGFAPADVDLIEAHGTGTVAGDIAEASGLQLVFSEGNPRANSIALGSVKSQVGHTKAAAGSASLIKAALALHHKVLPATINITKPNPKLGLDNSPFYLNTETRPWLRRDVNTPRRAGVSSFGFGGTNYHIVLEEYTAEHAGGYRVNRTAQTILLAGSGPEELLAVGREWLTKLQAKDAIRNYAELVENSRKSQPQEQEARLAFVAETLPEALELLGIALELLGKNTTQENWEHPRGIFYRRRVLNPGGKVVALFSGQGAQYLEMGRSLALNFPPLRDTIASLDNLFVQDGLKPLSQVVYPTPVYDNDSRTAQEEALQSTDYAQPAIGAMSVALYRIMEAAGFKADFTAGHSFGEFTALWAAGVLSDADYFTLVKARGQAMASPNHDPSFESGTMLAVSGDIARLTEVLKNHPDVSIANYNSPEQVVLAGTKAAVAAIQPVLKASGFNATTLPVSAAFHTTLVGHAQEPFARALRATKFNPPTIPVFSNATGQAHTSKPETIRREMESHMLKSVLFRQEIENIYEQGGFFFVEFGPRDILTHLVKAILGDKPHLVVALNASRQKDSDNQFRRAVAQLRVAGLKFGDIDPYSYKPAPTTERKPKLNVRLSGANYVSEATKKAFEVTLQDGFRLNLPVEEKVSVMPQEKPVQMTPVPPTIIEPEQPQTVVSQVVDYGQALDLVERGMALFSEHQAGTLRVHEQYLQNQGDYTRGFFDLMKQQQELLLNGNAAPAPAVLDTLERSLMRFQDLQLETLHLHEQYLQGQTGYSQNIFELLQQQAGNTSTPYRVEAAPPRPRIAAPAPPAQPTPKAVTEPAPTPPPAPKVAQVEVATAPVIIAPVKPAPVAPVPVAVAKPVAPPPAPTPAPLVQPVLVSAAPVVSIAAIDMNAMKTTLMEVVSEKTGYPTDMLEVDMDMEADLGIDSIKRVEILGAMQERYPELPRLNPDELAEMRTLGQILERMGGSAATEQAVSSQQVELTPPSAFPSKEEGLGHANPSSLPIAPDLVPTLMEVVSEKTGYPTDMLELDMDMEADLGIDSIKRVEILGAMQERFPELPRLNPDELAEMRTLGQIVERMSGGATPTIAPEIPAAPDKKENGVERETVRLKHLPLPDRLEFTPSGNYSCLLTDDGTPLTAGLAAGLTKLGWKAVVLSWPTTLVPASSTLPENIGRVMLEDLSEKSLEKAIKQVTEKYGTVGSFIHLNPRTSAGGVAFLEAEEQILKAIFLLARSLKKPLTEAGQHGRASFLTISRLDGKFGLDGQNYGAVGGGLFGLTKSLSQEWEKVHCRALDLSPELSDGQGVDYILAELYDPSRLMVEVAYSPEGRSTLVSEVAALNGRAG